MSSAGSDYCRAQFRKGGEFACKDYARLGENVRVIGDTTSLRSVNRTRKRFAIDRAGVIVGLAGVVHFGSLDEALFLRPAIDLPRANTIRRCGVWERVASARAHFSTSQFFRYAGEGPCYKAKVLYKFDCSRG
jgi:hypothetical protein